MKNVVTKKETSFTIIRGRLAKLTLRFGSLEKESRRHVQGIVQGTLSKGNSEELLICWQITVPLCRRAQGRRQKEKGPLKRWWM